MKKLTFVMLFILAVGLTIVACERSVNEPTPATTTIQSDMPGLSELQKQEVLALLNTDDIADAGVVQKGYEVLPFAIGWAMRTYEGTDIHRYLAFKARVKNSGNVKGEGIIIKTSEDPELRQEVRFKIDCLNIEGGQAIMSGVCLKGKDLAQEPGYWTGRLFQFKVIDGYPDMMTHFANGTIEDAPICGEDVGWDLWEIEAGFIIVHD